MFLVTPIDSGAAGQTTAHTGGKHDEAGAGRATGVAAVTTPSIAYRAVRKLMAESNTLGQAAPLLAALDASHERVRLRHATACTAGLVAYGNVTVSADPSADACTPAVTEELIAAYRDALSAAQRGLQALRSPVSASGPTLHPALAALVQLRALNNAVATTPTAPPEPSEVPTSPPIRARRPLENHRPVTATWGCGVALSVLSVPRAWTVAAGVRSGPADRDESRLSVAAPAPFPCGRPATVRRHRFRLAPDTAT